MNKNNFVYIDVRDEAEFMVDHIEGAVNIPVDELPGSSELSKIDKKANIIVYCRSGNRAEKAKKILEELGFKNVVNGVNKETILSMSA